MRFKGAKVTPDSPLRECACVCVQMACVAHAYLSVPLLHEQLALAKRFEGGERGGGVVRGRKEEQIETRDKNRLMMQ